MALLAAYGVHAATVTYDLSGTIEGGLLAGQTVSGQFSFDDANLDASTLELPLQSLNFSFAGSSFNLAGAAQGWPPTVSFNAGQLVGLNAYFETSSSGTPREVSLFDGLGIDTPYLTYVQGMDSSTATLSFAAAVPEPETYALMLAGLGLVGWMARRRKA
ncbi:MULTISPECIES: FxDxF family PEP-CTERM protein [unclassified Roseateles]|uniref:FxDxF family PEP-CTERM protein n=1 Tax=unclassified Roseateles TaxID=2626991 RepID=UPI00190FC9B9|nr:MULTISPECIES: FxDxF family PEP-CTERM protein [unclassified Roseateles]